MASTDAMKYSSEVELFFFKYTGRENACADD